MKAWIAVAKDVTATPSSGQVPVADLRAAVAVLQRALAGRVEVKAVPGEAEVVLQALVDRRERSAAATTAAGQVRELQLRLLATVRADTPGGRALMPPVALRLVRELSTTESATLAKAAEEAEIYREMQDDVVAQLLRRLAALPL